MYVVVVLFGLGVLYVVYQVMWFLIWTLDWRMRREWKKQEKEAKTRYYEKPGWGDRPFDPGD